MPKIMKVAPRVRRIILQEGKKMVWFSDAKSPTEVDDFSLDWIDVLARGETIKTFEAEAVASDIETGAVPPAGTLTTARIGDGAEGEHKIRYRIASSFGRVLEEIAVITVKNAR